LKVYFLGMILCSLLFLFACEDDPSSVGQDLLETQDVAKFYSIDSNADNLSISSKTFASDITYGSSSRTLVGISDNLKATALIKFVYILPDSIKDALSAGSLSIVESNLNFKLNYNFGDSTSNNIFELKRISADWKADNFDNEALTQIQFEDQNLILNQTYSDSSITIDFDKQTTLEWLSNANDSSFFNYGVLLEPTLNSSRILGFAGLTSDVNSSLLPSLFNCGLMKN
jgi:hypothetical protein